MRVLYIDLDCVRADHLGANGYCRNTSPNIDSVAKGGITFTNCACSNSPCVPSRAALFSGRFGINNGVVAHHGVGEKFRPTATGHGRGGEKPMIAEHLWGSGMKTVSFSSFADRHNAWWFANGWQELHTYTHKRGQETADEANAAFLPYLKENARDDNWFIHLHYWDCHSYYRTPEEWVRRFKDEPAPEWPDDEAIAAHQDIYGPRTARDLYTGYENWLGGGFKAPVPFMPDAIRSREDAKMMIDGYDGSIAYADYHLGQVLNALADANVLDDTAIIISADHGDSFGEHGQYMDHGIANTAVHNIPMVVRWPGMPEGLKSDELIYGLDLCPTLCDMLEFRVPEMWDGRSFAAALRGEGFEGWPYQVWDHGIYTFSRSVRTRDYLLMNMLHPGCYPYDEPYYLYDLRTDPHQSRDIASERPEVVNNMQAMLHDWRYEQLKKGAAPDPLESMITEGAFLYCEPGNMASRLANPGRMREREEFKQRLRKYHGSRFDGVFE